MKHLLLTFALMTCLSGMSWAQNGLVTGRVTDAESKEPLPGANVAVSGTANGTATNLSGSFNLRTATGDISLKVSYLGYSDTTITVSVSEGEAINVEINMTPVAFTQDGVTIYGLLEGQNKALNQQKTADNIKTIVAADQIGRFPDPNAAEALQRVPGVNIERDQGEGRYVIVRGLAPQFTNISINGEQIPSPEAGVRFVALDAIPADQLASMEVTKALTPDMDGDAIGGSVNLITRTAETAEPRIQGTAVWGYNNLMERSNIQGSANYSQRLGKEQKLGVMLNASYYSNEMGSDNWERDPQDSPDDASDDVLELRDYELIRTRLGLSSTIDYKFDSRNQLYFRTLYSQFTDREWRRRYEFEADKVGRETKDRFEEQTVLSLNLGGRHTLPKLTLDYEVSFAEAWQDTPYDYSVAFESEDEEVLTPITWSNAYPTLGNSDYANNARYGFDELEVGDTYSKDRNITGKINLGLPYQLAGQEGLLKFGGKVRLKEKTNDINVNYYQALGDVPNLDFFQGGLVDNNFLDSRYNMGSHAVVSSVIGHLNANPSQYELQIEDKSIDEALEAYEATENVYAAYIMARQNFNKLMLLGGVRYERTEVDYTSSDVVIAPNGDLQEIRPVSGSTDYDFILPQLHARYALNKNTNLRAAMTFSYARPNFEDIIPSQEINREDREATIGNTELKPVGAMNLDLLGEHYFGNVGVISGGLFFKRMNDFIFPRSFESAYPVGSASPTVDNIRITQIQNGDEATLFGAELAFQRQLDFLPGALSGLGIYANYTYTNSDATIPSRTQDNATESIQLPGQAEHVGNLSLSYEYKGISARAAMNFNGAYLSEVAASQDLDVYVRSRAQLDLTLGYAINDNVRFFAEFLNLTNQPFEAEVGQDNPIMIQREFYSWWSRIGLKVNL